MIDVLARHADVVGDLVDVVALFGTGQDAGAAEPVNGRMVGVVRVDGVRSPWSEFYPSCVKSCEKPDLPREGWDVLLGS